MIKLFPVNIYIGLKYKVKISEKENNDGSYSVTITSHSPDKKPHKTKYFFHGDRCNIVNWLSRNANVTRVADYYKHGVHISVNEGGIIYVGL